MCHFNCTQVGLTPTGMNIYAMTSISWARLYRFMKYNRFPIKSLSVVTNIPGCNIPICGKVQEEWIFMQDTANLHLSSLQNAFGDSPLLTKCPNNSLHSVRNWLAPVKLPSPPITHRFVIPLLTRLYAAFMRPSFVWKSLQRALPMTVPP